MDVLSVYCKDKVRVHSQCYTEGLRGSLENRNSYDDKTKLLDSFYSQVQHNFQV